ncbi:hypothetical protein LTR84_012090 [Exophiala bonariae]|uniref:Dopey N-terminal domain-containing protein n=1 Tax=Exophiala bonariae TaxID=1690606 RepID=A0AAV9NF62_9EURO|nr:hypothetical protein LTR84_012090 [Exophiala bonariae]
MATDSKAVRRYHAGVERALGLFDASNEWADYIAFLSRLAKSLQASPPDTDVPFKPTLAKYLALCLKPSLPAGVHQKCLEVYDLIFSLQGKDGLSRDLGLWLPGISQTLTFASLTTRPLFLSLYDEHILKLSSRTIRPALRAIILSLLPGIEEENSEDFDQTLRTFNRLREIFKVDEVEEFFWQSLFLASITSVNKRPGALVYLSRYLPKLGPKGSATSQPSNIESDDSMQPAINSVTTPEPGLLVRCFATGLQDDQQLVQRGFLDLLVSHLPLDSPILRSRVTSDDLDILVSAAMSVVLRRDMSLNRRLWTWFMGREDKREGSTEQAPDTTIALSPTTATRTVPSISSKHDFFVAQGLEPVTRSLQKMLSKQSASPAERARPFRIMLSLMDRWVIGRQPVDSLFIAAMRDLQQYQTTAPSQTSFDEVFRSANVFFDAIEPKVIAAQLFLLLRQRQLDLIEFILSNFSLQEDDMTAIHLPFLCLAISEILLEDCALPQTGKIDLSYDSQLVRLLDGLLTLLPPKTTDPTALTPGSTLPDEVLSKIERFYSQTSRTTTNQTPFLDTDATTQLLLRNIINCVLECLGGPAGPVLLSPLTGAVLKLVSKSGGQNALRELQLGSRLGKLLSMGTGELGQAYEVARTISKILDTLHNFDATLSTLTEHDIFYLTPALITQLWGVLLPSTPQFHVEAVELIWNLRSISKELLIVDSKLMELICLDAENDTALEDHMARFSTLWLHTRFPEVTIDFFSAKKRTNDDEVPWAMLRQPVLSILDGVQVNQDEDPRRIWLSTLPSLRPVFKIVHSVSVQDDSHPQLFLLSLHRISKLVTIARQSSLQRSDFFGPEGFGDTLLEYCTDILSTIKVQTAPARSALSILRLMIDDIDIRGKQSLIDLLIHHLSNPGEDVEFQEGILETLQGIFAKPSSEPPPNELIVVLMAGISSPKVDSMIDKWITLLCNTLPLCSTQNLFTNMLKLTSCFCGSIKRNFEHIQRLYGRAVSSTTVNGDSATVAAKNPEKSINNLLAGLEYILARAHTHLSDHNLASESSMPITTETTQSRSVANNRLTVILCMQDTIKLCGEIWAWRIVKRSTNTVSDTKSFNYMSSRLRTRTRKILEHLADAEPQECLETLMGMWVDGAKRGSEQVVSLNLMQSLDGARPKFMMPATFNAIYNRTNPAALDRSQKSSLSVDVSAPELMAFLIAYTSALEDDLLEEIWADCTAFLREVLANPMPHRQVLLRLLEFVAVLCKKMENTNFGEVVKMRRELADLCARLFTAIFTIRPVGLGLDSLPGRSSEESKMSTESFSIQRRNTLAVGNAIHILCDSLPVIGNVLGDSDRLYTAFSGIALHITGPALRAKQFPHTVNVDMLRLMRLMSKSQPNNKVWKKDVLEAFNDPKFFQTPFQLAEEGWLPLLRQVFLSEKGLMTELLARLTPPTTAGLMFGVGATAARTEADRRTQLTLKRIAILLLVGDIDTFAGDLTLIMRKLEELLTATVSSSPSSSTRGDIYTLLRTIVMSFSQVQLVGTWPIVDIELRDLFTSMRENSGKAEDGQDSTSTSTPASQLQGAKLLDLLLLLKPEEFQLHEWLFVTDTVDAVYPPPDFVSTAVADVMAFSTNGATSADVELPSASENEARKPWLCGDLSRSVDDVQSLLRPFFRHLSIHAFEDTYSLQEVDFEACRGDVLADVFVD